MKTLTLVPVAVLSLSLSACGRSSADDFVGLWSQTGTVTLAAQGQATTNPVDGNQRISRGIEDEQIILDGDCAIPATVDGEVATIPPGFSCTQRNSSGTMVATYRTGTLRTERSSGLSGKGATIVVTASGDLLVTANGQAASASFTMTKTLSRIAE